MQGLVGPSSPRRCAVVDGSSLAERPPKPPVTPSNTWNTLGLPVGALVAVYPAVAAGVYRIAALPWLVPGGAMSFAGARFPVRCAKHEATEHGPVLVRRDVGSNSGGVDARSFRVS
jgi:hypothetical protein